MGLGSHKEITEKIRRSDNYNIARAKLKFGRQIKNLMRNNGMSTKAMALKMKCTSANVSKLVNSERNLRLESMMKLARAAGGEFHFDVREKMFDLDWSNTHVNCSPAKVNLDGLVNVRFNDSAMTLDADRINTDIQETSNAA